jgi:Cytochrome oxidase complex assembly protein 1
LVPVRIHRQWFILGGASIAFLVGGSALGVSAIESTSRGPAFHLTATCLRVNARVRQLLGVITGYGLAVSGPVAENSDGTGNANLQFDVIGQWRTGRAHVRAVRAGYIWHWAGTGSLLVAGTRYRLHLDRVSAVDPSAYSSMCAPPSSITPFHPG